MINFLSWKNGVQGAPSRVVWNDWLGLTQLLLPKKVFFGQKLDSSRNHQDDHDQKDQANTTTGKGSPISTVAPGRQGADKH